MPRYVECKTYGHKWVEYLPPKQEITPRILACWKRLCLRCTRCGASRHDGIDVTGDVLKRSYARPNGYSDSKDTRLTRAELRLIIVKRRRT